jgi:hypothetical protein
MSISTNVTETIQDTNTFLTNFIKRSPVHAPIGDFIAPPFRVKLEAGKYLKYTDDIHRIFENKITGRQKALEIQWEAEEDTYACEEYAMSKFVGNKAKAQSIAPIKLEQEAAFRLKQYQQKARDDRVWAIAGSAAIVTQTINIGAAWNGAAGTPISDILTGMATIEASIGVLPNRILVPTQVALRMIRTTEWQNYFMLSGNFGNVNGGDFDIVNALRTKLNLQTMVTSVRGLSTYKCTSSDPAVESLTSDSVLLFYSEPSPSTNTMSFMYSPYVMRDIITRTKAPRERGIYIDIYEDIDELLVEANCAYLMTNCI